MLQAETTVARRYEPEGITTTLEQYIERLKAEDETETHPDRKFWQHRDEATKGKLLRKYKLLELVQTRTEQAHTARGQFNSAVEDFSLWCRKNAMNGAPIVIGRIRATCQTLRDLQEQFASWDNWELAEARSALRDEYGMGVGGLSIIYTVSEKQLAEIFVHELGTQLSAQLKD